jgi:hypothetical protein
MRGKKTLAALAITTSLAVLGTSLAVLATSSAAWSYYDYDYDGRHFRGGYVKPCSLDGVNPAYHRDIFGNPALARAVYGFVQARDGSWHVQPNCRPYD